MLLDNIDALKTWLINELTPITEADTTKLAEYVIALLKKDKLESDLRKLCNDQLKAFLEEETKNFVNKLFETVQTKKYLQQTSANINESNSKITTSKDNDKNSSTNQSSSSNSRTNKPSTITSSSSQKHSSTTVPSSSRRHSTHKREKTSSYRNHRTRARNGRSFSHSESSESRSNSRSKSRSRSSRSRSKSNDSNNNKPHEEDDEEEEAEESKLIGVTTHDETTERGWKREKKRPREQFTAPSSKAGAGILGASPASANIASITSNYDQYNPSTIQPIYVLPSRQSIPGHVPIHPSGVEPMPIMQHPQQMGLLPNAPLPYYQQQQTQLSQQQQQQRNALNMLRQVNRPRSLVSIVTHEEDNADQKPQTNKQKFNKNGKGLKRAYTHDSQPIAQLDNKIQQPFYPNMSLKQPMPVHFNPQMQQQQQQNQPPIGFNFNIPQTQMNEHLANALIIRRIPKELNNEEKMREHFQQFGKIINIQIGYNNLADGALVQFSTQQEAQAAYKCPQPVFNNRFIRLYWLNQQQKQNLPQQQKWSSPQQNPIIVAPANDSEPVLKKHVKERLDFNNVNTIQQQKTFNDQYNKENKQVKESKSIIVSPSGSLTKTVYNTELMGSLSTTNLPTDNKTEVPSTSTTVAATTTTSTTTTTTTTVSSSTKLVNTLPDTTKVTKTQQQMDERKALILKLNEKTQKLIEEQINQQKILLQKIEQAKTAEEKSSILSMIKKISELIEQEKASIVKQSSEFLANTSNITDSRKRKLVNVPPVNKLNKSTSKPHIISNKLVNYPINTSLVNSADTTTITNSSGTPAFLLSTPTAPVVATTKTYSNFRQISASVSVDHRPKDLLITDIENEEEKNLIIKHMKTFSNVETVKNIDDKSIVLEFLTRKDAEIAFTKGSVYKNKPLSIKWYKNDTTPKPNKNTEEEVNKPQTTEIINTINEIADDKDNTEKSLDEKLISSTSLNETELNEVTSEPDVEKIEQQSIDEELEDDNDEDEEESRPWRS